MQSFKDLKRITVFKGDGIGPEIMKSVLNILNNAGCDLVYDYHIPNPLSNDALKSIYENKIIFKSPLETPIGKGYTSLNLLLRKKFNVYANYRPVVSLPNIPSRYKNIDLITIRENTEGEYIGIEHEIVPGVVECSKVITRDASLKIAKFAFNYAIKNNRKKITSIHKANIMKKSDGLFLESCREISKLYPYITYNEVIVDACCEKLVINPNQFDILLCPNLYGDIISDLAAGLIGGLGVAPSASYGDNIAIYEAVHGSAPDIANKGIANPLGLLLSSLIMLKDLGKHTEADRINKAINKVLIEGTKTTKDIGGYGSTFEFTQAIINKLE